MQACSANQHQVIMPSWLPKVPSWLRKNALCLSLSAFSNFALHVISTDIICWWYRKWKTSLDKFVLRKLNVFHPFTLQFMFHLRRSQFLQVFNNSPDETAYYRYFLNLLLKTYFQEAVYRLQLFYVGESDRYTVTILFKTWPLTQFPVSDLLASLVVTDVEGICWWSSVSITELWKLSWIVKVLIVAWFRMTITHRFLFFSTDIFWTERMWPTHWLWSNLFCTRIPSTDLLRYFSLWSNHNNLILEAVCYIEAGQGTACALFASSPSPKLRLNVSKAPTPPIWDSHLEVTLCQLCRVPECIANLIMKVVYWLAISWTTARFIKSPNKIPAHFRFKLLHVQTSWPITSKHEGSSEQIRLEVVLGAILEWRNRQLM